LAMYEANSLDVLNLRGFPPRERGLIRQRLPAEYVSEPELSVIYTGFRVDQPPFDEVRVRQAFVLATDRERLADVVLGGDYSPATGGFVPPGMPGSSAGIGLPYDPDQARDLLAEAGYPGGRGFPAVEALAFGASNAYNEYVEAQWRENLGVDIIWEFVDWATLLDRLDREPPHLFGLGEGAYYPDPDSVLRASSVRHHTRWQNPTYDGLVEKAKRIPDQAERIKLYAQADRILVQEAVILPLTYGRHHRLVKPWVTRFPTSAMNDILLFSKDVTIEPH
jgi:oligopeptide transport system substrate-binding protein